MKSSGLASASASASASATGENRRRRPTGLTIEVTPALKAATSPMTEPPHGQSTIAKLGAASSEKFTPREHFESPLQRLRAECLSQNTPTHLTPTEGTPVRMFEDAEEAKEAIGGRGTFGNITFEERDGAISAIKKLSLGDKHPAVSPSSAVKEINLQNSAAELGCSPKILDTSVVGSHYLIRMEKIDGKNLFSFMEKKPISEAKTKKIIFVLLHQLKIAHINGLYHLDLKLENIMIKNQFIDALDIPSPEFNKLKRDHLQLIDWGQGEKSEPTYSAPNINCTRGTMTFMHPALIGQEENFPGIPADQCDLYSVGVIAQTLLKGHPPTTDIFGQEALIIDDCSENAKDFIQSLSAKQAPRTNLSIIDLLVHPWFAELSLQTN